MLGAEALGVEVVPGGPLPRLRRRADLGDERVDRELGEAAGGCLLRLPDRGLDVREGAIEPAERLAKGKE